MNYTVQHSKKCLKQSPPAKKARRPRMVTFADIPPGTFFHRSDGTGLAVKVADRLMFVFERMGAFPAGSFQTGVVPSDKTMVGRRPHVVLTTHPEA